MARRLAEAVSDVTERDADLDSGGSLELGVGVDMAGVAAAAESVPDPELPVVTLGDLGIVRGVALLDDGTVEVAITPTYVGCPATEAIAADVRAAVSAYVGGARVVRTRTALSPAWSTDWITDGGRRKLAAHGIAPPSGDRRAAGPVLVGLTRGPAGRALDASLLSPAPHPTHPPTEPTAQPNMTPDVTPDMTPNMMATTTPDVGCPSCGSTDTRLISAFGSTPCQSLRACRACGEPFGAIKTL